MHVLTAPTCRDVKEKSARLSQWQTASTLYGFIILSETATEQGPGCPSRQSIYNSITQLRPLILTYQYNGHFSEMPQSASCPLKSAGTSVTKRSRDSMPRLMLTMLTAHWTSCFSHPPPNCSGKGRHSLYIGNLTPHSSTIRFKLRMSLVR